LDVLLRREPFLALSALAVNAAVARRVDGLIAGHAVTTIAYLLQREVGSDGARDALRELMIDFHVAAVTDECVRLALSSPLRDFEDAVTQIAAAQAGVDLIVTRDTPDFAASSVPAFLPEAFLATL
jgi:hypothetical protein